MMRRCYNSKAWNYHYYGGRGIIVCERWHQFENFRVDMLEGWSPGLTLDRRDNQGNYEPLNCAWATRKQQQLNKR